MKGFYKTATDSVVMYIPKCPYSTKNGSKIRCSLLEKKCNEIRPEKCALREYKEKNG